MLVLLFLFTALLILAIMVFLNLYLNDFEKKFKEFNEYLNDRYKLPLDEIDLAQEESKNA